MSPSSANRADSAPPRIDQILEALILALLLYLPLAFGGVMPQSQIVLIAFGSLIAACFTVRCLAEPDAQLTLAWALVPAAGLAALALLQLAPLPIGLVETLSPHAAEVWKTAAAAAGETINSASLSVYPHGTRNDFVLLACGVIVLGVGATIYRDRAAFRRLLYGVALIGLLVATIGLAQIGLGADKIYWHFEGPGSPTAGPFASHSHFSEFINIGLGCAVGAILIRTAEHSYSREIEVRHLLNWNGRGVNWLQRALLLSIPLGIFAIVFSTSRNGLISLAFGAAVAATLMHMSRKVEGIGWPMIGMATFAIFALLSLGVDPVIDRFQDSAAGKDSSLTTRIELIRDTASMSWAYAIAGAGLGTYALAFPTFDTAMRGGTAEHAENQYVEALAEMGLVGGLLTVALIALVLHATVRQARRSPGRTDLGLFGILFGLSAIAFHSLTDFGLEIPAVGVAVAAIAGAALARNSRSETPGLAGRLTMAGMAAALAISLVTTLPSSFRAADGFDESLIADRKRADLNRSAGGVGTAEDHAALVNSTAAAAAADPTNVEYRFWAAFAQWNSDVAEARGHSLDSAPATPAAYPELEGAARRTVTALLEAIQLGPTHGPSWSVAGQLQRIWLPTGESEVGGDWVLRGRALAPHHPSTCMAAAFEHLRRGEETLGLANLDRVVTVGGSKGGVVDLLAVELERPNLALPFVEGDLNLTDRLLHHVQAKEDHAVLAASLKEEVWNLLIAACARPSASPRDLSRLANMEVESGSRDKAKELYQRLLSVDPLSRQRFNYAQLLLDDGAVRDARRELRDVIQFHPNYAPAKGLLKQLESGELR